MGTIRNSRAWLACRTSRISHKDVVETLTAVCAALVGVTAGIDNASVIADGEERS